MPQRSKPARHLSNEARLRRAIASFLAELRALPPEPALIPIPELKPRTRQPR